MVATLPQSIEAARCKQVSSRESHRIKGSQQVALIVRPLQYPTIRPVPGRLPRSQGRHPHCVHGQEIISCGLFTLRDGGEDPVDDLPVVDYLRQHFGGSAWTPGGFLLKHPCDSLWQTGRVPRPRQ